MPSLVVRRRSNLTTRKPRLRARARDLINTTYERASAPPLPTTLQTRLRARATSQTRPTTPPSPYTIRLRARNARTLLNDLKRAREVRVTAKFGEERASDAYNTLEGLLSSYTNNMR
jgi:hypothetical protein